MSDSFSTCDGSLGILTRLAKYPWEGNENCDDVITGVGGGVSFNRFREIGNHIISEK